MYTEKVMDHFRNPRNIGTIENADAVSEIGNAACGDLMKLYLKIDEHQIITDIKFQTFGCAAAIACSSMVTVMAKGKSIDDAEKITKKDVADQLDGLPPVKMHCSNLGADGLQLAIRNYKKAHNLPVEENDPIPEHDECELDHPIDPTEILKRK